MTKSNRNGDKWVSTSKSKRLLKQDISERRWIELEVDAKDKRQQLIVHKEQYCPFCNSKSYRTLVKTGRRICIKNGHAWLYEEEIN